MVNSFGFDFGRGTPARRLGIYFHAVNGTLYADYGKHKVVPEGKLLEGRRRAAGVDPAVARPRAGVARLDQDRASSRVAA